MSVSVPSASKRQMKRILCCWLGLMCLLVWSLSSEATVRLDGTRLIYDAAYRDVSIRVHNLNSQDIMLQSWLSSGATGDDKELLPMALTPVWLRMKPGAAQLLRIMYQGEGFPKDRETLVWLNVMEIPQVAEAGHSMQMAIRQRLKVFFRPEGLPGRPTDTAQQLNWEMEGESLRVHNPGAFHASLVDISLVTPSGPVLLTDYIMVPPFTTVLIEPTAKVVFSRTSEIIFAALSDVGLAEQHQANVQFN